MSFLPEITKLMPLPQELKFTIFKVNKNEQKGDSNNKQVFLFEPWKKSDGNLNWTVGNVCSVK